MMYISDKCKNEGEIVNFLEALNSEFNQRQNAKDELTDKLENAQNEK